MPRFAQDAACGMPRAGIKSGSDQALEAGTVAGPSASGTRGASTDTSYTGSSSAQPATRVVS